MSVPGNQVRDGAVASRPLGRFRDQLANTLIRQEGLLGSLRTDALGLHMKGALIDLLPMMQPGPAQAGTRAARSSDGKLAHGGRRGTDSRRPLAGVVLQCALGFLGVPTLERRGPFGAHLGPRQRQSIVRWSTDGQALDDRGKISGRNAAIIGPRCLLAHAVLVPTAAPFAQFDDSPVRQFFCLLFDVRFTCHVPRGFVGIKLHSVFFVFFVFPHDDNAFNHHGWAP